MEIKNELIPSDKQQKLAKQGAELLTEFAETKEVIIRSVEERDNALDVVKRVKIAYDEFEADRKEITKPLNDKVTSVNTTYKSVTSILLSIEKLFKDALTVWDNKQEQKKLEADRAAQIEADRIRRAAQNMADKELEKAEAYREQGKDTLADKAEAKAEEALNTATSTVAPVYTYDKGSGTSFKIEYEATIQDAHKAINALNTDQYRHMIEINTGALGKLAKSLNGKLVLEGVLITAKKKVAIRKK